MSDAEQMARDFYNNHGGSYPPVAAAPVDHAGAELARVRAAFAAVGADGVLARGVPDARFKTERIVGEADLRRHYGDRYDEELAVASGLVKQAAQRSPDVMPFLSRTGLGNDPELIKQLAAAARRRRG